MAYFVEHLANLQKQAKGSTYEQIIYELEEEMTYPVLRINGEEDMIVWKRDGIVRHAPTSFETYLEDCQRLL